MDTTNNTLESLRGTIVYSESDYRYSWNNVTNFISRDKCKELALVNGCLKIYCEVDILESKPQLPVINLSIKETATLTWSIDGFNSLDAQVISQAFSAPNSKDNQFALHLIPPNEAPFDGIDHVYIRLHYNSGNREIELLKYCVSIIDTNGQKRYTRDFAWNYSKSDNDTNSNENVTNYLSRDKCNELAVNDSLKIYCEVSQGQGQLN